MLVESLEIYERHDWSVYYTKRTVPAVISWIDRYRRFERMHTTTESQLIRPEILEMCLFREQGIDVSKLERR